MTMNRGWAKWEQVTTSAVVALAVCAGCKGEQKDAAAESADGASKKAPSAESPSSEGAAKNEAGDDAADNKDVVNSGLQHGLLLQVGNEVKLTDTVGLTVAYQYTNKASSLVKSNVKDAKDEDKDNRRVSSHGWSAGVRVAL